MTPPMPQPGVEPLGDGQLLPEGLPFDGGESAAATGIDLLNSYAHLFVAAYVVTLLLTPLIRRLAIRADVVDHPDAGRKAHRHPVPYLGGLAVFAGLIIAIGLSYFSGDGAIAGYQPVPIAVVVGMVAITFTGLADDVWGWDPRFKIAGQLVAAAALALEEVGVKVAAGLLSPLAHWLDPILGSEALAFTFDTPIGVFTFDLVYWVGTAIIAVFVLGGCNSANLIDGLDGLLSGIVGIAAIGLLAISLLMVRNVPVEPGEASLAGARIVLCVALLGAVLGFLPHNFNPATIFLGDCGSHLLGYMCAVIILMLGEYGQTHLVFAGLIIFGVPIMDTTLAIIRRRLAGTSLSAADDQHLHHQLKRALGGVARAVLFLYGIGVVFAVIGVTLAALVMLTGLRVRLIYAIALVLFSSIGVVAVKAARRSASATTPATSPPAAPPTPAARGRPAKKRATKVES